LSLSLYLPGEKNFDDQFTRWEMAEKKKNEIGKLVQKMNFNLVLHMSATTFFGAGSSGPLSLCPEVKCNHPFQNPTSVVFTR
jgi:hypothetical protein